MKASKNIRIDFPDEDLRQRVSKFLHSRHFPIFRTLDIDVQQGEVTITGVVHSFYEKQIAMTSCQHVAGVIALIDEIAVRTDSDGITEVVNQRPRIKK